MTIRLNFAGSSQLATQLTLGAQADLFASANEVQMKRLVQSGQIIEQKVFLFASNRLVLIIPRNQQSAIQSLDDLTPPGIKLVTATEEVPIAHDMRELLKKIEQSGQFLAGFEQAVLANIVSEEANVRQLVTKVELEEADGAIVYQSDVTDSVRTIPIPDENIRAYYFIAPLYESIQSESAKNLIEFIQSPAGQTILQKWGFLSS